LPIVPFGSIGTIIFAPLETIFYDRDLLFFIFSFTFIFQLKRNAMIKILPTFWKAEDTPDHGPVMQSYVDGEKAPAFILVKNVDQDNENFSKEELARLAELVRIDGEKPF